MQIRPFIAPGLAIVSYLIFDEATRLAAVIDPTRHIENYLRCAHQENVQITDILETHVHADFASGAKDLKAALQGKPKIHCSGLGGKEWSPHYADQLTQDRQEIILGEIRLQAWHTPGHTPEHLIWIVFNDRRSKDLPALAFTGDLLFAGSIGRPDLLGEEMQMVLVKQLYNSLFETLAPLPDSLEIFPAHGAGSLCGKEISSRNSSTLGYERRCNPWLIKQPFEKWSSNLLKDMPIAPKYFKRMKTLNLTGLDHPLPQEMPPLVDLTQTLKLIPECLIIDVRKPDVFAVGHLKNALNIPLSPSFTTWAGAIIPDKCNLLVVASDVQEALFVIQSLKLIGIDSIKGICNTRDWTQSNWPEILHSSPMVNVGDVNAKKEEFFILDVRTQAEWQAGHIAEAHHIELAQIPNALDKLPRDTPIAVFCGSGVRASLIASHLKHEGFSQAVNVRGGMQAWMQAGLPVTKGA